MHRLTRREAMTVSVGGAVSALIGPPNASATPKEAAAALIATFTGGKTPDSGSVTLDLPDAVEDGSSVPLSVAVDQPMRPDTFVSDILVVADANPWPGVAAFRFTPLSGRAEATTRIRLAGTQTITAIAKTSDGRFFQAQKRVQVTVGACTGT